jgi:glycosyltransferase involved in cell wall biosynthesis
MKVTITAPGKFMPAFAVARRHEQRGELARIVTPVPVARSRRFGVSDRRNAGLAAFGAWNYAFQRLGPRAAQQRHQLVFSAAFDEAASRMLGGCDVVNPWCSTALRTIRAAHRRGMPAVLEVASAHIEAQAEILRAEHERFGADIDRAVLTPGVIERTLREYDEADAIIVMAECARRTFVARGFDVAKVSVVPLAVDPVTQASARRGDAQPPRVLFVGGCSLRKGTPYLVEAFRRVAAPATLRLVGRRNDALFDRSGGLPANAIAAGPRTGPALAAEYAAADVFVLPSVEDGWGLVTNEAMSASLPVIVSDQAGSAELVRDGVNGFVVPARDVDTLADRLDVLLRDATLRARMGAEARATVAGRTWESYASERRGRVFGPLLAGRRIVDAVAA